MSTLSVTLDFLREFGFFDIILPFLLIFAVVFGILEKTKILGEEKIGGENYPKKNLDAIIAFVIAMLVVATTKIVGIMNVALPRIALLIVVSLSFILMIGVFISPGGVYEKLEKKWLAFLMILAFIIVVLIFLSAIPANEEESWLEYGFNYAVQYWTGPVVGSIVLFALVIWAILYITSSKGGKKGE